MDDRVTPPADGYFTRLGERVAALETKADLLERQSETIRLSVHDISKKMNEFVALQEKSSASMAALVDSVAAHTEEIKLIANEISILTRMRYQMDGVWWAIARVCAVVVGGFTVIGTMIGGVIWLLENHVDLTLK